MVHWNGPKYVVWYLYGIFRNVRKIAKTDYQLRHVCVCVCLSVRMEQLGSYWTDFHEIWYLNNFRKTVDKIQVSLNLTIITGTLHENLSIHMIISRWILLIIGNVSDRSSRYIKTHILYSINVSKNSALYEIMWKNMLEPDRSQMTIYMATGTHSNYVIIIAFPRQLRLREHAWMLRCTNIFCFVKNILKWEVLSKLLCQF
jgi:hypothetical protein